MNYLIAIDLIAQAVAIVVALYFTFILFFGGREYGVHSFVLVVYSAVYYFMPELDQSSFTYRSDYLVQVNASMLIEGAGGFGMMLCWFFDKLATTHAKILSFAVCCHVMVYCHIQSDPEWILPIAYGFYAFYDELIILVGLMQMAVSHNGFMESCIRLSRAVQSVNFWIRVHSNNFSKYLSERKKRKGEAKA